MNFYACPMVHKIYSSFVYTSLCYDNVQLWGLKAWEVNSIKKGATFFTNFFLSSFVSIAYQDDHTFSFNCRPFSNIYKNDLFTCILHNILIIYKYYFVTYFFYNFVWLCLSEMIGKYGHLDRLLRVGICTSVHKRAGKSSYFFTSLCKMIFVEYYFKLFKTIK